MTLNNATVPRPLDRCCDEGMSIKIGEPFCGYGETILDLDHFLALGVGMEYH